MLLREVRMLSAKTDGSWKTSKDMLNGIQLKMLLNVTC